jgi:hypothetical protein
LTGGVSSTPHHAAGVGTVTEVRKCRTAHTADINSMGLLHRNT